MKTWHKQWDWVGLTGKEETHSRIENDWEGCKCGDLEEEEIVQNAKTCNMLLRRVFKRTKGKVVERNSCQMNWEKPWGD